VVECGAIPTERRILNADASTTDQQPVTHEQFAALVRRLEDAARRSPRTYRLRVLALAGLGYAYIGAVLLALLGLLGGLVWTATLGRSTGLLIKGGAALGYVAWVIARSLWVRIDPPAGIPLKRVASPALFECVDELRRRLKAPRVHEILLCDDFNAAVVQYPRLGVLGLRKNFLILGLPFLQSATAEEFRSVLGHELGHLSGQHGRLRSWVYRVRASWSRLAERLEEEAHWSRFVFRSFFHWYAPCFAAWSYVLARQNELEADRASAEVTSPEVAGASLTGSAVRVRFLHERFWPAVYAHAEELPSPDPVNPFATLPAALGEIDPDDARRWLEEGLAEETTVDDTHPCLRERLAALGVEPRMPDAPDPSAAVALLGKAHAGLVARLAEQWRFAAAEWWSGRYEYVTTSRKRLGELTQAAGHGELAPDEAWERARLTEEFDGGEQALPLYRELLEGDLEDAAASFALGRLLLARGEESGLVHLDRAMDLDADAIVPACELACRFLAGSGHAADAASYRERGLERQREIERDAAERNSLPLDAVYLHHRLEADALEQLRKQLARWPVKRAWLVRKPLDVHPERPLYVLGVERRVPWWRSDGKKLGRALQAELVEQLELPGECFVLALNGRRRRTWRLFRRVSGSQIHPA
jgi:Zn-dependent protease with chaperone function